MIGFSSIVLTQDKNYLLAGDFYGFIHIFPIKYLLKNHHLSTIQEEMVYKQTCFFEVAKYAILDMKILSTGELILADRESVKLLSAQFLNNAISASLNQSVPRSLLSPNIYSNDMKKYKTSEDQQIKAFLCKNENIYVGTDSGQIIIFDKMSEKIKNEFNTAQYLNEAIKDSTSRNLNPLINLKQNPISSMILAKDGQLIIGSQIGVIQLWKIQENDNLEYIRTFKHEQNCFFEQIYTTEVFYSTLFCGHNGFITAWDIQTGNLKYVINAQKDVYLIKVVDENRILVGGDSKYISYYNINNGQKIKSISTTNNANLSLYYEFTSQNTEIDTSNLLITAGSSPFLDVFYNNLRIFLLTNPNTNEIQQLKLQSQNLD
ncbi:hypothetical protein TTHERM_00149570 (macronuclear) [Tetrahymena thermophila SB210]|uniref:WD domain, G-beta repeat protein n=1 Tax=Tetrahymena thermophila (strain SB210) TaxID=312017 RepID=I7ML81_TETTS|nr:hypothetical protein TTHERM_00149570 [Tetrahymena thermophila SB210]EAS01347.2 hypothetical protein TTHERM_00149570 [Tetrahymena thermophila SB210]|eukprot:XP_001021592.2 hypothetical protein TTHERM_00149570 [Tetrahymena thermophila SB210]